MIEMKGIDIRQAISKLEQQKPKNIEEFEFRESEIRRYLNLLINGEINEY
ncbi:hypothetical protein ES702_00694 [subsurface metagenome]